MISSLERCLLVEGLFEVQEMWRRDERMSREPPDRLQTTVETVYHLEELRIMRFKCPGLG